MWLEWYGIKQSKREWGKDRASKQNMFTGTLMIHVYMCIHAYTHREI